VSSCSGTKAWANRPRFRTNNPGVANNIFFLAGCSCDGPLSLNSLHRRMKQNCAAIFIPIIATETQKYAGRQIKMHCKQATDRWAVHAENYSWRQTTAINRQTCAQANLETRRQADTNKKHTQNMSSRQETKKCAGRHKCRQQTWSRRIVIYRQINRGIGADR
jgi:hypothetical protein